MSTPCPTAVPAFDLFVSATNPPEHRIYMLLTTITSVFAFDGRARCVIKICLQLFSFLLCACTTIVALENVQEVGHGPSVWLSIGPHA